MSNNKTNAMTAKIVEYRFIGKSQLNADDMGGVGCATWDEYLNVCSVLAVAAWNHSVGKSTDENLVGAAIAGLFDFFGISVVDSSKYVARILPVMVSRKANRSDALKDALKDKKDANEAYKDAVIAEKPEEEIAALKAAYDDATAIVDGMYAEPYHYWFDPAPMFDKKTLRATAKARKALEDTCADIFNERKFMSAEELQAERIRLDDERKGRKARKKAEAKAEANK